MNLASRYRVENVPMEKVETEAGGAVLAATSTSRKPVVKPGLGRWSW